MRKVIFGFFIFITFLLFRPIFNNLWYPMHDATHVSRAYLLEKTLLSGQIPAIWASELNDGAGYPLFHFYAPLTYYLALFGKLLTGSYFTGLKLVLVLALLLGMSGMYLLVRKWGRPAGLIASLSYAFLPYAAVNLYVRGAFAEYLAMGLLPWVFYCWVDLSSKRKQVLATMITSLFLLSHNLIPLIAAPFLLVWIILNRPKNLQTLMMPVFATLLLSSFYLVPLLFERTFVQADSIARTTDYSLHFVSPSQLWNSTWGYGGSTLGIEDGMSFKVGKVQLILATLGSILVVIRLKRKELFYLFAALISLFMTTSYSHILWSQISLLSIVQFPWRYLVLSGFFVSILAGYSVTLISSKSIQNILSLLVIQSILFFNLKYFMPATTFKANLNDYISSSYLANIPRIIPEYSPVWTALQNQPVENIVVTKYLYYPTWVVKVEGKGVDTFPSADGYLAYHQVSDSSQVTIYQSHTFLENISLIISVFALIYLIKFYVKN